MKKNLNAEMRLQNKSITVAVLMAVFYFIKVDPTFHNRWYCKLTLTLFFIPILTQQKETRNNQYDESDDKKTPLLTDIYKKIKKRIRIHILILYIVLIQTDVGTYNKINLLYS